MFVSTEVSDDNSLILLSYIFRNLDTKKLQWFRKSHPNFSGFPSFFLLFFVTHNLYFLLPLQMARWPQHLQAFHIAVVTFRDDEHFLLCSFFHQGGTSEHLFLKSHQTGLGALPVSKRITVKENVIYMVGSNNPDSISGVWN